MFHTCSILIKLSLTVCVLGASNVDSSNKTETERKFADLEASINQKLNKMESNTLDRIITYIDHKIDTSNKKIEDNFENKITQAMNASNKKGEENLLNITQALNVLNKRIEEYVFNTTQTFYVLNKKMEKNIFNTTQTFNSLNKKTEDNLEEKKAQISNALDSMKEDHKKYRTSQLPCKEVSLGRDRFTPHYSMDSETLNHATVKRDSAGRLTYFELHVAIQADERVQIRLVNNDHSLIYFIDVGCGSNQYTKLWHPGPYDQQTYTPEILSSTEFRTFYIKVDNGTLQFGKEGDSTPLISHYHAGYRSLGYFKFLYHGDNTSKIRYDCPHVTELPCKDESLSSSHRNSPHFSVDSETLNHGTVQRDSAGRLTYFELHVAIQADAWVEIDLRDKDNSYICYLRVGTESNQYTKLWDRETYVQRTHTPDILSSTQFRTFYIKVDDGTLQFGKEGDSTPLISHYDDRLRSLDYFSFYYNGYNTSEIRYDCPPVPESS